jgi:hypothetical protein
MIAAETPDLSTIQIDETLLSELGFKPCTPYENWHPKYMVTPCECSPFNDDGFYKWYGYKESASGSKWYVVWNNVFGGYYFQRQVRIYTLSDLINVYFNSTNEHLIK